MASLPGSLTTRRGRVSRAAAPPLVAALLGCSGAHSSLAPHGPVAEAYAELGRLVFAGGAVILLAVMALAAIAVFGPARARRLLSRDGWILGAGAVFPVMVLSALLVYGLQVSAGVARGGRAALAIEVVGEQWWWRVRYVDAAGVPAFETANEIRIPTGEPVELRLTSADVIHSFWVPSLAGKLDMIPGRVNRLRLEAGAPGTYRGQCAEYCGGAHALMALFVVAETPQAFEAWHAAQRAPAAAPATPLAQQGAALFQSAGCGACHTVRGTPAAGAVGPDLTHVGSRVSLAAGTLPNGIGPLAAWIASAQHLKPQNRMPSFRSVAGADLRALAGYLETLE